MFKVFSGVLNNTKLTQESEAKINNYIFKRYISGNIDGLMFTSYINAYEVPKQALYEYYRCILSPRKLKYIPYFKEKKKDEDIEFLMFHYKCNREIANEYLDLLTKEQLESLKANYNMK